jgi:dipeptidyl aminopeptidase/acylaminoacyl peptidase
LEDRVIFVFDGPSRPGDLWCLTPGDGTFRQLTHSLPDGLRAHPFATPAQVCYPSLDAGIQVPALLYRPADQRGPGPAVMIIHGGPNWLAQVTWDPLIQAMVSRGWTVLAPNYRGSIGYGREWQLANRFDLGGCDTQDVAAGADYLVRASLAEPGRIALTGRSWGGYLTMTCLTGYPERWAGGSAVVPFLNFLTAHANSREDLQHWDLENMGDPVRDRQRYLDRSPYFFLDRIRAPVQLIAGTHDVRCPASESIEACRRLRELGRECDLVLYPDEGHAFLKRENYLDAEIRRLAFLTRVLEDPPGLFRKD